MGEAVGICCGWGTCGHSTLVESVRGLRKAMHNDGSPDLGRLQNSRCGEWCSEFSSRIESFQAAIPFLLSTILLFSVPSL